MSAPVLSQKAETEHPQPSRTGGNQPPVVELQGMSVRFGKRDILQNLTCSLSGRAIGLVNRSRGTRVP